MSETAFVFEPRAPHADSLANPRLMIRDRSGKLLVCFCPRHMVGGVYDLEVRAWTLYTPMEPCEFIAALPNLGVQLADGPDLQVWLDAISMSAQHRGH